jgi:hypothetical protein
MTAAQFVRNWGLDFERAETPSDAPGHAEPSLYEMMENARPRRQPAGGQRTGYPFRSDADLAELVHSTFLRVSPRTDLKMQLLLTGRIPLVGGDTYLLDLLHQARVGGDKVTVTVEVPAGWEIIGSDGLRATDARHARVVFDQNVDRSVSIRLRQKGLAGLWSAVAD